MIPLLLLKSVNLDTEKRISSLLERIPAHSGTSLTLSKTASCPREPAKPLPSFDSIKTT